MDNKNINDKIQLYRNNKVSKELFIGLIVCLLLDKQLFRANIDAGEFIRFIFNIEMPLYTLRSRTLMIARLCRMLNDTDDKSIDKYSNNTYSFMKKIIDESDNEYPRFKNGKNDSLSNMNKWISGILRKEHK